MGDVFIGSFSKSIVLDIYSGFINNFSVAMDLAKQEAKRKSALADFFKVKQISAHDRLSFFGLMVKPVQRFPQFILFLQVSVLQIVRERVKEPREWFMGSKLWVAENPNILEFSEV